MPPSPTPSPGWAASTRRTPIRTPGPCVGCELAADLDFDTNGNGATYTGTGNSAESDSGDAYHNGGGGWGPIGGPSNSVRYASTFKGNGHTHIQPVHQADDDEQRRAVAVTNGSARIESLGVVDGYAYGYEYTGILVGVNYGNIAASYTTGEARGREYIGGMAGGSYAGSAAITARYSRANVSRSAGAGAPIGGLVGHSNAATARPATMTPGTSAARTNTPS